MPSEKQPSGSIELAVCYGVDIELTCQSLAANSWKKLSRFSTTLLPEKRNFSGRVEVERIVFDLPADLANPYRTMNWQMFLTPSCIVAGNLHCGCDSIYAKIRSICGGG